VTQPEFSRPFDIREANGRPLDLAANAEECAALARRFDIVRIERLEARLVLEREGDAVAAKGDLTAALVQSCAVSGDDLSVKVSEALEFRFVPAAKYQPDSEVELTAEELDEIEYTGTSFDLGEAVAQSLALAIDPFLVGPGAEAVRKKAGLLGESETGAFAALKGLLG
jgi:uncharacterized metal-binding protein YceD (DUF177 family)